MPDRHSPCRPDRLPFDLVAPIDQKTARQARPRTPRRLGAIGREVRQQTGPPAPALRRNPRLRQDVTGLFQLSFSKELAREMPAHHLGVDAPLPKNIEKNLFALLSSSGQEMPIGLGDEFDQFGVSLPKRGPFRHHRRVDQKPLEFLQTLPHAVHAARRCRCADPQPLPNRRQTAPVFL